MQQPGFCNYNKQDWAKEILNATGGKGLDIVIDFVGSTYFQGNLDVAGNDGRVVNLGSMSGTPLPAGVDICVFIMDRLRFEWSSLRSRDQEYQGRLRDKLEEYLPKVENGTFRLYVDMVIHWENMVEVYQLVETNATKWKLICMVS